MSKTRTLLINPPAPALQSIQPEVTKCLNSLQSPISVFFESLYQSQAMPSDLFSDSVEPEYVRFCGIFVIVTMTNIELYDNSSGDVIIALMGMTGAGKSSLISLCSEKKPVIGHDLNSCKS
ncbi:hypothetical protein F4818DRAFT_305348 [Hypoxylon cercidicola]|nr:hypothetical protein F4818DRAFT_305348 [Hypoxylon cercidicola]